MRALHSWMTVVREVRGRHCWEPPAALRVLYRWWRSNKTGLGTLSTNNTSMEAEEEQESV